MLVQFGGFRFQIALQRLHVGSDQQCAVMQPVVFPDGEGVAGEFPALVKHVVASGAYSFQSEMFECVLKN